MNDIDSAFQVVAITGHRDYPDPAALYRGLDNLHAKEYVFGGARGIDSDALEYIAKSQPGSIRTVVVPNRLIDQPASTQIITKKYATEIIELRNTGYDRYQIRNRYMVDRSTHVRAFYDFRGSGGTYNTIEYSKSIGKSYSIWDMNKMDIEHYLSLSEGDFRDWFMNMKDKKLELHAIKSIILEYFYLHKGMIPQDVANELQTW